MAKAALPIRIKCFFARWENQQTFLLNNSLYKLAMQA